MGAKSELFLANRGVTQVFVPACATACNDCLMVIYHLSIRNRVYSSKLVNDSGYLRSDFS